MKYNGIYKEQYVFRYGAVPSTGRTSWKSPFRAPKAHRNLKYQNVCKDDYEEACSEYNLYVSYESIYRQKYIPTSYDDILRWSFREHRKKGHRDKKNGRRYNDKYKKMGWSLCPKTLI